jgi:CRISPR-associated protein Cmr3
MGKHRQRQNQKPSINPDKQKRKQKAEMKRQQLESEKQMMPQECPDGTMNLEFTPMDTWFFRESRPHDAAGATELRSLFPPPIRTLMGAVRRFLGDSLQVNWKNFNQDSEYQELKQLIGHSQSLGQLSVNGVWVCKDGARLYPAPSYLMQKGDDFIRLQIGDVVECDLGKVRLPELQKNEGGYKGLEQTWVTAEGWQKLLDGETLTKKELYKAADLFSNEPRLGIAINNASRSVIDKKLYQTQHLRLKEDVTIQLDLKGLDKTLVAKLPAESCHEILRLGGEGRMASLTAFDKHQPLPCLQSELLKKFIIHFITAADFNGKIFPETFEKQKNEIGQIISWKGTINEITFIIEAAVIGKVHREGGWDMQKHQPRAVKSYIPAGSAWFCRLNDESLTGKEVIEKLNGQSIGAETEWGRGQILIGVWHDTAKTEEN